jgi:hypothetical protein
MVTLVSNLASEVELVVFILSSTTLPFSFPPHFISVSDSLGMASRSQNQCLLQHSQIMTSSHAFAWSCYVFYSLRSYLCMYVQYLLCHHEIEWNFESLSMALICISFGYM